MRILFLSTLVDSAAFAHTCPPIDKIHKSSDFTAFSKMIELHSGGDAQAGPLDCDLAIQGAGSGRTPVKLARLFLKMR